MQLHAKIEFDPSKTLGQEEVSLLLIQAINDEHGFTWNNQVHLWESGWIKYPHENLLEDVRCILKNKWTRQNEHYILRTVLHRTFQKPGRPSNRIPFVNGYLDTRSMKLVIDLNYVRDNKILNYQRFEYDPNARCPIFETVLSQVFSEENGDKKKKALLQYFAYCLIPDNYQKALFLYCPQRNPVPRGAGFFHARMRSSLQHSGVKKPAHRAAMPGFFDASPQEDRRSQSCSCEARFGIIP